MNQKSHQNSKTAIEKDFYKLLNNLDNCRFDPICDEINEISYIRNYHKSLFDKKVLPFVNSHLLEAEIQKTFNNEMQKIKEDDPFKGARIQHLKRKKASDQEAVMQFKKKEKGSLKKRLIATY